MARKDRKIISNDDGWIMSNMTGPVTPQTIKERISSFMAKYILAKYEEFARFLL